MKTRADGPERIGAGAKTGRQWRPAARLVVVALAAYWGLISAASARAAGESAGPEAFRIGNAVAPIHYWMTAWTLNDLFKMTGFEAEIGDVRPSRAWAPVVDGEWLLSRRWDVPTDDRGWPTSLRLRCGERADQLTTIVLDGDHAGAFPAGEYTIRWRGSGRLEVEGGVETVERGEDSLLFRYRGEGPIVLSITSTDPGATGDYIRDVRVLRPDAVEGETFNRRYVEELRPFAAIRPLHFLGDQLTYGPALAWEDRKGVGYSHWGGALGAPYEAAIELANESDSDLWLNVPIAADDEFIASLAALAAELLDDERRLYVEVGNELWNIAEPYELGRRYALERARERWPGVEGRVTADSDGDAVHETMMIYSWQGARTTEVGAAFREAFDAERDRVVVVLAGQIGASMPNWAPSRYLLESPVWVGEEGTEAAAAHADAFAVAPYIGEEPGSVEFSRASAAAFIGEAIEYVRGEGRWHAGSEEPGLRHLIRSDRALAEEFGLPLIAYEGGQHFVGSRFTRDEVNTHPKMYELYQALFDVWTEEGGGLFVHYGGIIPRGVSDPDTEPSYYESENFGAKERQPQSEAEAPKWRALRDRMRALGQFAGR